MKAHSTDTAKIPNTAAVLQLNCRWSHNVTYSLFNNTDGFNFLFVALQEPPINPPINLPSSHAGWHLVVCQLPDIQGSSRPRSCLYIDTRSSPEIQPIHHPSRDVSACTVKIKTTEMLVINVYSQPLTFAGFQAMELILRQICTPILLLPTIVVTDANLHSHIWNPETYQTHGADADKLVDIMTNWNLHLRWARGNPTYKAKLGMKSGVTIDLVWVN